VVSELLVTFGTKERAAAIKRVVAAAAPHHHPSLEAPAAAEFAALWVSDAHWKAADALTAKS